MARNSLPRTDADVQAIPAEFRDSASLSEFRRRLVSWFRRHGRVLPWRETADPYRIWVSEIMLQQTTVKAVIPYYERFLDRFPDIRSLAAASEGEVLQYWEGLGYYSRGRNLRLAAIAVCDRYAGRFPETVAELQILPGIGRYTAGAIRSFAFDLPAPIVEANTLRLYCRLLAYDGDPTSSAGQKLLWSFAESLQPGKSAGRLNQALMELGATVCLPVNPMCETCPIRRANSAAAESRMSPATRTRTPVMRCSFTVRASCSAGPARSLRCGPRSSHDVRSLWANLSGCFSRSCTRSRPGSGTSRWATTADFPQRKAGMPARASALRAERSSLPRSRTRLRPDVACGMAMSASSRLS